MRFGPKEDMSSLKEGVAMVPYDALKLSRRHEERETIDAVIAALWPGDEDEEAENPLLERIRDSLIERAEGTIGL